MSNSLNGRDNLVIVVSKAIQYFKIPITKWSIENEIKTHPDYPALKSVTDTLDHFNITNYPVRITQEELVQIDQPFLAHTHQQGEELQFIERQSKDGFLISGNSTKKRSVTAQDFKKVFSGAVILLESSSKAGELDFNSKRKTQWANSLVIPSLAFLALSMLTLTLFQSDIVWLSNETLLLATKLLGLGTSLLLVAKDQKSDLSFADKLCRIGKKADCDTVTNHPSATVLGWVKWSDLGLIYFLSGLFLTAHGSIYSGPVKLLSLVALPYLFYSIYLQAIVIKKWCPLCLIVLFIIASEFAITIASGLQINTWNMLESALYTLMITALVLLTRFFYRANQILKNLKTQHRRIKRSPGVLECVLTREQKVDLATNSRSLLFGSHSYNTPRVSVFLSLDCRYCGEVFQKLKHLTANSRKLHLHIIPVAMGKSGQKAFTALLCRAYRTKGQQAVLTLLHQWYSGEHKPEHYVITDWSTEEKEFMKDNIIMVLKNQIIDFPAVFIAGYKLPENYSLSEILEMAANLPVSEPTNTQVELIN